MKVYFTALLFASSLLQANGSFSSRRSSASLFRRASFSKGGKEKRDQSAAEKQSSNLLGHVQRTDESNDDSRFPLSDEEVILWQHDLKSIFDHQVTPSEFFDPGKIVLFGRTGAKTTDPASRTVIKNLILFAVIRDYPDVSVIHGSVSLTDRRLSESSKQMLLYLAAIKPSWTRTVRLVKKIEPRDVMRGLLEGGKADPNYIYEGGETLLIKLISKKYYETARKFLSVGQEFSETEVNFDLALSDHSGKSMIDYLIEDVILTYESNRYANQFLKILFDEACEKLMKQNVKIEPGFQKLLSFEMASKFGYFVKLKRYNNVDRFKNDVVDESRFSEVLNDFETMQRLLPLLPSAKEVREKRTTLTVDILPHLLWRICFVTEGYFQEMDSVESNGDNGESAGSSTGEKPSNDMMDKNQITAQKPKENRKPNDGVLLTVDLKSGESGSSRGAGIEIITPNSYSKKYDHLEAFDDFGTRDLIAFEDLLSAPIEPQATPTAAHNLHNGPNIEIENDLIDFVNRFDTMETQTTQNSNAFASSSSASSVFNSNGVLGQPLENHYPKQAAQEQADFADFADFERHKSEVEIKTTRDVEKDDFFRNSVRIVKFLANAGADLNLEDDFNRSLLMRFISRNEFVAANVLVTASLELNDVSKKVDLGITGRMIVDTNSASLSDQLLAVSGRPVIVAPQKHFDADSFQKLLTVLASAARQQLDWEDDPAKITRLRTIVDNGIYNAI